MFKTSELLKATGGRLAAGPLNTAVESISTNSRCLKAGEVFLALQGAKFDGHNFIPQALEKRAKIIISQRRLPAGLCGNNPRVSFIVVQDTRRALADIARYNRQRHNIPLIAVTGSNGKTTTKEMLVWLLSSRYKVLKNQGTQNNHIGLPLALLKLDASYDIAVLEIGTNHFGEVANLSRICLPNVGVITNIAPAHLEAFGDLDGVFREKYSLIENLISPRLAFFNADDRFLGQQVFRRSQRPCFFGFGIKRNSDFQASQISDSRGRLKFSLKAVKFSLSSCARHNIYNALAAIAVARIFGLSCLEISRRLGSFAFPDSRFRLIKQRGFLFIDDTYNSNPFSLAEALDSLGRLQDKGRKILVMGDMLELGRRQRSYHAAAGRLAAKICDKLLTVGRLSESAAEAARISGLALKDIFSCENALQAREIIFRHIQPQPADIILVKGSRAMNMENIFKEPQN